MKNIVEEKMKEILKTANDNWNSVYCNNKWILWEKTIDNPYKEYKVLTQELFFFVLKNSFKELVNSNCIIDFLTEKDDLKEEIDNINFEVVFDYAFDNEFNGLISFYNPIDFLKDEDYKYIYLICHNHNAACKRHIEIIVYTNTKIENITKISEILGNKTPKDFNTLWTNHNFSEINNFEQNDLYNMIDENASQLNDVERIYI